MSDGLHLTCKCGEYLGWQRDPEETAISLLGHEWHGGYSFDTERPEMTRTDAPLED